MAARCAPPQQRVRQGERRAEHAACRRAGASSANASATDAVVVAANRWKNSPSRRRRREQRQEPAGGVAAVLPRVGHVLRDEEERSRRRVVDVHPPGAPGTCLRGSRCASCVPSWAWRGGPSPGAASVWNALSAPPVCSPSALTSIEPPTGLRSDLPWPGPTTRLRGTRSLTTPTLLRRSGRRAWWPASGGRGTSRREPRARGRRRGLARRRAAGRGAAGGTSRPAGRRRGGRRPARRSRTRRTTARRRRRRDPG